jgi:hypothetical protein
LSTKLIVSIAADPNKRSCRFFVAPPPPLSRRRSAEIWFNELPKQKYLDSKTVEVAVSDLLVAPIPDDDTPIIQEVKLRINKNSDLLTHCVGQLFEKEPVDEKSADGTFRCTVPRAAEQLTVTVALGQEFYSSIILPRPA